MEEGDSAPESPSSVEETNEPEAPETVDKTPEASTPSNDPEPQSEAPKGDLQGVSPDDLAGMTSSLPAPNQNAIDAWKRREGESTDSDPDSKPKPGSGKFSKKGEEFDPEFHAVDKDGKPIETKAGYWRKKPGKKSSRLNSRKIESESNREKSKAEEDRMEAEHVAEQCKVSAFAAMQATNFALGIGLAIKPNDSEKKELFNAYEEYYKFVGPSKMPPWLGPVLVTGAIVNNHIEEEAPKTRIEKIKEWIGIRIHRFKNRKGKKE